MTKAKKSTGRAGSTPSAKLRTKQGSASSKSTKGDAILNLLRRKQGASLGEMQKTSGWQIHSLRGYLSGTVKKRLGFRLNSSKSLDGERRYAIPG